MLLSIAARIMLVAAVVLIVAGGVTLSRLRVVTAGTPAAYAARIAGTMLVMLGLILIVFTLAYASATPLS